MSHVVTQRKIVRLNAHKQNHDQQTKKDDITEQKQEKRQKIIVIKIKDGKITSDNDYDVLVVVVGLIFDYYIVKRYNISSIEMALHARYYAHVVDFFTS